MAESGIANLGNGIAQNLLVTGYKCWVRAGNSASDAKVVGFVDSMKATKQIQLQRAQVCGSIMPASIDPQSYSVQLSLSGFLATPDVYSGTAEYNGGGKISLASFNPSSEDFVKGSVAVKFPYIDFYDEKEELIIASFKNVISSSYAVTVQGGTYIKADIQMEAIDMSSGNDYQAQSASNIQSQNS